MKGGKLKGPEMKGNVSKPQGSEFVNEVHWAVQFLAHQARQNPADAKAFTGRGKHLELRRLVDELDAVEQTMQDLVAASKAVPGHVMLLALHASTTSGLRTLRWRARSGAMRHLSWAAAADLAQQMGQPWAYWYQQATEQCVAANERHKALRKAIQVTRQVIARSTPHLLPRKEGACGGH